MYRVSPFTYIISSILSTGIAGANVECSNVELLHLSPPSGETCDSFLSSYIDRVGGYLANPHATSGCQYCTTSSTDQYLADLGISYSDIWRNVGILFAYIGFNIAAAVFLYWLARVPKKKTLKEE
jgi:ATP-binding cassette, subfamily G (WHITE), member 2, PDR